MVRNSYCSSKARQPCIYAILKDSYIYIGETQRYVFSRWGSHLSKNGSFIVNLLKIDEDAAQEDSKVEAISFHLTEIEENCENWEWKKVTQSIEHEVHLKIDQSSVISTKYTTISNTTRTAPLHSKYQWIDSVAENLVGELENHLSPRDG
mgnify:FL=1|jgi:hypothetical protein